MPSVRGRATDAAIFEPLHRSEPAPSSQGADPIPRATAPACLLLAGHRATGGPSDLGHAASTGMQNQMRYAWFPDKARLAIDAGDGRVRVYDTGDHRIGGFSQQQSGDQSLSFTSQHGLVKLSELREVKIDGGAGSAEPSAAQGVQAFGSGRGSKAGVAPNRSEAVSETVCLHPPRRQQAQWARNHRQMKQTFSRKSKVWRPLHAKGILTDRQRIASRKRPSCWPDQASGQRRADLLRIGLEHVASSIVPVCGFRRRRQSAGSHARAGGTPPGHPHSR
jgi:hypothetical protein